jgi:DNA invertase Pin-like site-specific DNA recombinase
VFFAGSTVPHRFDPRIVERPPKSCPENPVALAKADYAVRKPFFAGFPAMLVGYMRVSSDSDRQTTDLQRDALLAAGVDERHLFSDRASGAKDDRPGLIKALDFVKAGDCLVVWKLDRLGRSLPHLLNIVTGLRDRDVGFRSLTEQMDTTTAQGELLFHIFGALAQYERALTQERVRAGLAAARRRGRHGGRPRAIEAERLESVMAALDTGLSKAAICRAFGIPRSTLNDTLLRVGWTSRGCPA